MATLSDAPSASNASPELVALQEKLRSLTEVSAQLRLVRRIPTQLVKPPDVGILQELNLDTKLADKFQLVKEFTFAITSEKVQSALSAARASEQKDKSDLVFTKPRADRKRKRQPSPESPRVYIAEAPKPTSRFPPNQLPPLHLDGLAEYLRDFNRAHAKIRAHIVTSDRSRRLSCPLLLRFSIRDALNVFLTVDETEEKALVVENATAFSSREQKPPHSQSDFVVFQKLTQQATKMIQSDPLVSLQTIMAFLTSYDNLFSQKCTRESCRRILSAEAHIPPVARVWSENARAWTPEGLKSSGSPGWEPFHPTCSQR